MKCMECGADLLPAKPEAVPYNCGLPNVTLLNVPVRRCASCGDYEVEVPHVEALHKRLALEVTKKKAKLTPAEIRFLRKSLGWSGVDMARHFGVTGETVSRWENGHLDMGPVAERMLRVVVWLKKPVEGYLDLLAQVGSGDDEPLHVSALSRDDDWILATGQMECVAP